MFVFGILATVRSSRQNRSAWFSDVPMQFIASQTLITASFSLIQQLIKMHVLPPYVRAYCI